MLQKTNSRCNAAGIFVLVLFALVALSVVEAREYEIPPVSPESVEVKVRSSGSVQVGWERLDNAETIDIEVDGEVVESESGRRRSTNLRGLSPGRHSIRVIAVNPFGRSASSSLSFVIPGEEANDSNAGTDSEEESGTEPDFGEVVPTLVVPDPIDAGDSFYIEGYGFSAFERQRICLSILQGDYRLDADDDRPNSKGEIRERHSSDRDDWFADEATIVASLEDGTILAATTVKVRNGTGIKPFFVPEVAPKFDVVTPNEFREGDYFLAGVTHGVAGDVFNVTVIGDEGIVQYDFGNHILDEDGTGIIELRMPLVLDQGKVEDGRTIQVSSGGSSKDFQVRMLEGIRFGLETDNLREGKQTTAEIRNGIPESQVIFQIVHDKDRVVHEYGFRETDADGYGRFPLTIPTVLPADFTVDGFKIRAIHGGVIIDKSVTIEDGLRVVTGAQNVREGHNFTVAVWNGASNAPVTMKWWHDDTFVQNHPGSFSTNGDGDGEFRLTVPDLIRSGAGSDLYKLKVTHVNHEFELRITIYQSNTPDPGEPIVQGKLNANKSNSVRLDSIVGLAQLINQGASLGDIRPLVHERLVNDRDFYRLLAHVSDSIEAKMPLDDVSFSSLVAALTPSQVHVLRSIFNNKSHKFLLDERTENQLVILIHGKGATNADSKAGMNDVDRLISPHVAGGHVLQFQSGHLWGLSKHDAFKYAVEATSARLAVLESLGTPIKSVVIAGYSWGGGMAKYLAKWFGGVHPDIEISGFVYLDAVVHGGLGSEFEFPPSVTSVLNVFQSNGEHFQDLAHGRSIRNPGLGGFDGTAYYGRYREIDVDANGDMASHTTIDEMFAVDVADFILHVLDEWYWHDLTN